MEFNPLISMDVTALQIILMTLGVDFLFYGAPCAVHRWPRLIIGDPQVFNVVSSALLGLL